MPRRETVKTVRAIRPNVGIEREYRRRLNKLIRLMNDSVVWWIRAEYRKQEPRILSDLAADASPAETLAQKLRKLSMRWKKTIEPETKKLAYWFIHQVETRAHSAMKSALKKIGMTVTYRPTRAERDVMQSVIEENVSLIRTIPEQYFAEVEGLVQRSVQAGRDLGWLTDALHERYEITRRRAAVISRDQNSKATDALNRARDADLGITEGIWVHVPGNKSSRHSHVMMDGKRFNLAKGMYDPDVKRFIHCGELINCNCLYKPIIPVLGVSTERSKGNE